MKDFLKKNKKAVLAGAIIVIFTILLCIPATLRALVGVFGYAAYFYLVAAYALFVMKCKNKKLPLTKSRLALYVAMTVLIIMTLHVGLCGKALVESGAGGYIGGSYEKFTVGGVLFSLLSLPVVLLCKFIASVIIYFVATAVCGFFLIMPLVFENAPVAKKKHKKVVSDEEAVTVATQESSLPEKETVSVEESTEPAPSITVNSSPVATEEPEPYVDKNSPEYARMLLFGNSTVKREPVRKPVPQKQPVEQPKLFAEPQKPNLFNQPKADNKNDNPYRIIDGMDAILVPPDVTPYTNSYLNTEREEAKRKLFSNTVENDYAARQQRLNEKTTAEDIKETMKVNPYIPSETVFETVKTPVEEPVTTPEPTAETPVIEQPVSKEYAIDENDEIIDVLPTIKDSPFAEAIRADKGDGAPVNVFTSQPQAKPATAASAPAQTRAPEPKPAASPAKEIITENEENVEQIKEEPRDPNEIRMQKLAAPYVAPPVSILEDHVSSGFSPYVDNYAELKDVFENKIKNYGIDAKLVDVVKGPTITLCVLDLAEKCSINTVTKAEKDIERLLMTPQGQKINILTKLPDSTYFGIEVPNKVKGIVSFKEIMASPDWNNAKGKLLLGLGKTNSGDIVIEDIAKMPHALIAGSSGSGKSVCINTILASLLYRYSPDELKLILIDLKYVEMANYADLPHMLFRNPLNEVSEVINALNWLRTETNRRFLAFRDLKCRDLDEYNAQVEVSKRLPRILIIIDEASELMTHPTGKKVMEATLSSLARVARAAGVHMLFATQTPSKDVITSEIQNNMTTKIAFAVSDYVQSQVIFKSPEAAKLLGQGDMIIKKPSNMTRAQCAFVSTSEINKIVDFVKDHNKVEFDDEAIERILHGSKEEAPASAAVENKEVKSTSSLLEKKNFDDDSNFQELVKQSLKIFVTTGKVSATYIQRRFAKGYNTIANVMDYLQDKGYVSEPVNNKRSLLISKSEFYELYPECKDEDEI